MTSAHNVKYAPVNEHGLKEVFVKSYNDHLDEAVVLVEEPAYDLAILKTKRKDYKPMELASEITLGENVYALSFQDKVLQIVHGVIFLASFYDYLEKNDSKSVIKGEINKLFNVHISRNEWCSYCIRGEFKSYWYAFWSHVFS